MSKARAQLVYSPRDQLYTVIDTHYNHLVILTSSYCIADYWRSRVDQCRHPIPYDILGHDRRVDQWMRMVEAVRE